MKVIPIMHYHYKLIAINNLLWCVNHNRQVLHCQTLNSTNTYL